MGWDQGLCRARRVFPLGEGEELALTSQSLHRLFQQPEEAPFTLTTPLGVPGTICEGPGLPNLCKSLSSSPTQNILFWGPLGR